MIIPFTQYLLPNGRTRSVEWETTSHEQEIKARALLDAKARFECEMLQTGQVSLTCEIDDNNGETQTLAHEICANNPEVVEAVGRLVESAHNKLIENSSV